MADPAAALNVSAMVRCGMMLLGFRNTVRVDMWARKTKRP